MVRMRFLPDEPIVEPVTDLLGFGPLVDQIVAALEETETPFVFGILGDWGTGKTSLMRLVEKTLRARQAHAQVPHLIPIWFNAWLYENEADVVYPLLYTIKKHHDETMPELVESGFSRSFLKVVGASALALADLGLRMATKKATGEALSLEDLADQLKRIEEHPSSIDGLLRPWADKVGELRATFETLIDRYAADYVASFGVRKENVRFVVLIDDLDRCLPDSAVKLLEKIKNFLAVQRAIFILGLNPKIVHQGVRVKYRGLDIDGQRYLEKILNYAFHVPEPEVQRLRDFASGQLSALLPAAEDRREMAPHFETFGEVLAESSFQNPRKIKRILNRYLLFLSRFEANLLKYDIGNIARLIVLAEYFPDLFRLYLTDSGAAGELRKLGTDAFQVDGFEKRYGISLAGCFIELSRMRALFQAVEPLPASGKLDLRRHAKDVFSISRID